MKKSAQRDANTARALAVVRLGHRPPARCHKPTDRTDYNTQRAQCKKKVICTLHYTVLVL